MQGKLGIEATREYAIAGRVLVVGSHGRAAMTQPWAGGDDLIDGLPRLAGTAFTQEGGSR
jgi:hypothetical protein